MVIGVDHLCTFITQIFLSILLLFLLLLSLLLLMVAASFLPFSPPEKTRLRLNELGNTSSMLSAGFHRLVFISSHVRSLFFFLITCTESYFCSNLYGQADRTNDTLNGRMLRSCVGGWGHESPAVRSVPSTRDNQPLLPTPIYKSLGLVWGHISLQ